MANPQDELAEQIRLNEEQLKKEEAGETKTPEELQAEQEAAAAAQKEKEDAEAVKAKEEEEAEAQRLADEAAAKEAEEKKPEGDKQTHFEEPAEKRYSQSTREAQKLSEDKKTMDDALHEAENIPDPTDEELKVEFPEWDDMSATEHRLAKDSLINKRFRDAIQQGAEKRRAVAEWDGKVDTFIENPQTLAHNTDLEGKQDEFKIYAKDKSKRNINMDVLIKSFLYDQSKLKGEPKKGQMFETGSGGAKEKETKTSNKLSIDDSQKLMATDYNKYVQYLQEGKIETEIE